MKRGDPFESIRSFDPVALDRTFGLYRAALCGATLLMIGLSWPLWVDDPDFPRVPFFSGRPELPSWVSWVVLGGIVGTLGAAAIGRAWRVMLGINLGLLTVAILSDQNRFQPWAYQYLVIGLAMATMSKARALRMARWYVFGLYWYSGLSKLDASFCREMGPLFLVAALKPLGLSPSSWPDGVRSLAILAMPAWEIAVATFLAIRKTRRIGLVGSIVQHAALVMILGPWGLDQSAIVLVWNVALGVENVILFGRSDLPTGLERDTRFGPAARVAFWAAMILPAGERLGLCDPWPGHALYASHCERADVFLHEDDLDRFPEAVRRRVGPAGVEPWRRLDLTGWSRDVRGTPVYPSRRVGLAMAEFLESRYRGFQPIRVVEWGRAPAWDGPRDRVVSIGLEAIRLRGNGFLLNTHPSGVGNR